MSEVESAVKHRTRDLLIEIVVIVFSVLLALAVDDWRQVRTDQRLVRNVTETIRAEVEHNREAVELSLPHHEELVHKLRQGGLKLVSIDLKSAPRVDLNDEASVESFLRQQLLSQGASIPRDFSVSKMRDGQFLAMLEDRPFYARVEQDTLNVYGEAGIRLKPAFIRNVAWETALATRATVHMNYWVVSAVSELYQLQRRHDETVKAIVEML